MSCSGACGNSCAAQLAIRMLKYCLRQQEMNLAYGRGQDVACLQPLFVLYQHIKTGVCAKSATLPFEFVPDLEYLFAQLPDEMRYELERAIVRALQSGQGPFPYWPQTGS